MANDVQRQKKALMNGSSKDQYDLREQKQKVDSVYKNTPKAYNKKQIRQAYGFERRDAVKSQDRVKSFSKRGKQNVKNLKNQNLNMVREMSEGNL